MSKTRFMWVAALIALCVGLTAGGALAAVSWLPLGTEPNPIPAGLAWNQSYDAEIYAANSGSADWPLDYQVISVDTPSGAPVVKVDRWGDTSATLDPGVLGNGGDVGFPGNFYPTLVAPPISPMSYPVAGGDPVPGKLTCKWVLADGAGALFPVTPVGKDVNVGRFKDTVNVATDWCRAYVDELAGLFPKKIVGGYPDGTYLPNAEVTRAQMAVFMKRALDLPTAPYAGTFSDVPDGYWAGQEIEALSTAGLVNGYPDGSYGVDGVVNRASMAVFVARGLVGGTTIPAGPATATFSDVATDFWAYNEVEYCVANNVVHGYPDGTYLPGDNVTRGMMAVFIYRAFVAPDDNMIVIAGPGLAAVDPTTVAAGVSTVTTDPAFAYVAFDAARLGALVPTVDFAMLLTDNDFPVASGSVTLDAGDIAAAVASGVPQVYAVFPIPALAAGSYTLEVSVGADTMPTTVAFTVAGPG